MFKKTILSAGLITAAGVFVGALPAQAGFNLGAAYYYAVLYEGTGSLNLTNATIFGNVGVGNSINSAARITGSGDMISGSIDFSAPNSVTNQITGSSIVTTEGINYSSASELSAINTVNGLGALFSGFKGGTNLSILVTPGQNQTIDASSGYSPKGYSDDYVFSDSGSWANVNSGGTLTINGSASDAVVINISNSNVIFEGNIKLTGGITFQQVFFNIIGNSGNSNLTLGSTGATEQGIFIDPKGGVILSGGTLFGGIYDGGNGDYDITNATVIMGQPATLPLVGGGLLGLGLLALRQRRQTNR